MSQFYVACDLGPEKGRMLVGTLHKEQLTVSELRHFENRPLQEKGSLQWNIPSLYHEILEGLRAAGSYDEPVDGISCTSWSGDYLLFAADGSLMTPAFHYDDPRSVAGMKKMLATVPWESLYEETGIPKREASTLFQLAAESPKRLKRASHLLPIADGFNFLLAGVPRVELSLASSTQLYALASRSWSGRLSNALRLPPQLLPPIVPAGTLLGPLRAEIAKETRLTEARVIASCSHQMAAVLAGLPLATGESWAYLRPGNSTLIGVELDKPLVNELSRDLEFSNESGFDGAVRFQKQTLGLWILQECQRFWDSQNRQLDFELLNHLAGSATAFESLINPADPRFSEPGDMPLKIQAFCKETGQVVPRKPGPIFRCILESLALLYRRTLEEIEYLTGSRISRLYVLDGAENSLLNHFIANALQLPTTVISENGPAIGNIVVQAIALGHLKSLPQARELVRSSFKNEFLVPHATAWNGVYDRFVELSCQTAAEDEGVKSK